MATFCWNLCGSRLDGNARTSLTLETQRYYSQVLVLTGVVCSDDVTNSYVHFENSTSLKM